MRQGTANPTSPRRRLLGPSSPLRPAPAADLKSPTRGGQTAFPEADVTKRAMGEEHRPGNSPDEWYCYDERVLSAAPPPGTGVLFWWAACHLLMATHGAAPVCGQACHAHMLYAATTRPTPRSCAPGTTAPATAPAAARTATAQPTPPPRPSIPPCTRAAPCWRGRSTLPHAGSGLQASTTARRRHDRSCPSLHRPRTGLRPWLLRCACLALRPAPSLCGGGTEPGSTIRAGRAVLQAYTRYTTKSRGV